jgi:hypothetical protein
MGVPCVADNHVCASACFTMWAAGKYRQASPLASIGVHSISNINGGETLSTMAHTTEQARELAMDHVSPAVIGKIVSTPPGVVAWLTADDRESMNVEIVASKGALIRRLHNEEIRSYRCSDLRDRHANCRRGCTRAHGQLSGGRVQQPRQGQPLRGRPLTELGSRLCTGKSSAPKAGHEKLRGLPKIGCNFGNT